MKNNKKILSFLLALTVFFSCFTTVLAEEAVTVENGEADSAISAYDAAILKNNIAALTIRLAETYYYGVTDEDLLYRALCSAIDNGSFDYDLAVENMMDLLKDKYSEFYSAERYQSLYTDVTGEFYGIGVTITLSGDNVVVMGVFPNSPAEKSGIQTYDTILAVDGNKIQGMSVADVARLIKREKGNKVTLEIKRGVQTIYIDCYCDEVDQNPTTYEILEDGKIGYIYISDFTVNLDSFITPILAEFEEKGIKDIILDIRNNGGGELNAAISLANHFIPEGVISKVKYKDPENNQDITITNGLKEAPYNLVLLVNEYSASASELFTGAVKDRNAGVVIGTKTYGKGSMQSMQRLHTGAGIKYTVAEFHSPNDNRIHQVGITPDYTVENTSYTVDESKFHPMNLEKSLDITEGVHILAIEERLHALGCMESEPDEIFDDETREALRYIQLRKELDITGEPDLYTLVALNDIVYDFDITNDDQLSAAI
ncbi:MAG: S41 family peptidase, partial [Clostridia bacterium]